MAVEKFILSDVLKKKKKFFDRKKIINNAFKFGSKKNDFLKFNPLSLNNSAYSNKYTHKLLKKYFPRWEEKDDILNLPFCKYTIKYPHKALLFLKNISNLRIKSTINPYNETGKDKIFSILTTNLNTPKKFLLGRWLNVYSGNVLFFRILSNNGGEDAEFEDIGSKYKKSDKFPIFLWWSLEPTTRITWGYYMFRNRVDLYSLKKNKKSILKKKIKINSYYGYSFGLHKIIKWSLSLKRKNLLNPDDIILKQISAVLYKKRYYNYVFGGRSSTWLFSYWRKLLFILMHNKLIIFFNILGLSYSSQIYTSFPYLLALLRYSINTWFFIKKKNYLINKSDWSISWLWFFRPFFFKKMDRDSISMKYGTSQQELAKFYNYEMILNSFRRFTDNKSSFDNKSLLKKKPPIVSHIFKTYQFGYKSLIRFVTRDNFNYKVERIRTRISDSRFVNQITLLLVGLYYIFSYFRKKIKKLLRIYIKNFSFKPTIFFNLGRVRNYSKEKGFFSLHSDLLRTRTILHNIGIFWYNKAFFLFNQKKRSLFLKFLKIKNYPQPPNVIFEYYCFFFHMRKLSYWYIIYFVTKGRFIDQQPYNFLSFTFKDWNHILLKIRGYRNFPKNIVRALKRKFDIDQYLWLRNTKPFIWSEFSEKGRLAYLKRFKRKQLTYFWKRKLRLPSTYRLDNKATFYNIKFKEKFDTIKREHNFLYLNKKNFKLNINLFSQKVFAYILKTFIMDLYIILFYKNHKEINYFFNELKIKTFQYSYFKLFPKKKTLINLNAWWLHKKRTTNFYFLSRFLPAYKEINYKIKVATILLSPLIDLIYLKPDWAKSHFKFLLSGLYNHY